MRTRFVYAFCLLIMLSHHQLFVYFEIFLHFFLFQDEDDDDDDDDDFEDDTLKIKLDGSFNNTTTYSIRSPMYHNR